MLVNDREFCMFRSDYWNEKCIGVDIYVPFELYTDSSKDEIEQELALLIGKELLKRDLLCFNDSWKPDNYGDIRVHCQANVLELKNREGKMPSRLKDIDHRWIRAYMNRKKGDETMNDNKREE